jgi:hypothetical protein
MTDQEHQEATPAVLGSDVVTRTDGVVEAEVDGERILLSPVDFSYFGLTGTGAHVWELIDGERTLNEIIDTLKSDYEANPEEIIADVNSFVDALKSAGLIN